MNKLPDEVFLHHEDIEYSDVGRTRKKYLYWILVGLFSVLLHRSAGHHGPAAVGTMSPQIGVVGGCRSRNSHREILDEELQTPSEQVSSVLKPAQEYEKGPTAVS